MNKENGLLKVCIFAGFAVSYIIPLIVLSSSFSFSVNWFIRLVAVTAFVNTFVQVMLGSFRPFFRKHFNPNKVYNFHNILGVITLGLVTIHAVVQALPLGILKVLTFNTEFNYALGAAAFYVMLLTVISSDLKYFFKINYNYKVWRAIHLLNYALFFLIFFHANGLGSSFASPVMWGVSIVFMLFVLAGASYRVYLGLKTFKKE